MDKPVKIIDRDAEWAYLTRMWESAKPELYIVRGRRRVGKSFLLSHAVQVTNGIYYQATRRTDREQLASISRVVGRHFDDPALRNVSFGSWEDLFAYCIERGGGEPLLIVLDEFPYLTDAAPALPSILQSLWDHDLQNTQIKLVLSGSHITAMKRLTEAEQPLYGRRTGLIQVDPLDYLHASAFVSTYTPKDKIIAYGLFGGLPGHLSLLDSDVSLAENVVRHILDPTARLNEEAVHCLDAFLGDAEVHYSIIEAIANGEVQWQKISNRIGRKSAALSRPLDWLKEMEIIEQIAPLTEYPKPSPKSMVYRLRDPYLQFWHQFVADAQAQGIPLLFEPGEVWQAFIEPRLNNYIGRYVFEEVCREFVRSSGHERLPFRPLRVGSWWTADAQEEIDIVALGMDGEVLLGECKWGSVGRDDVDTLMARVDRILPQIPNVRSVQIGLFSGGAIDTAVQPRIDSGQILLFTPADLFPK